MGKKMTQITKDYGNKYNIFFTDDSEGASIPQFALITIPQKYRKNECNNYLFVTLHEIGHCETFSGTQTLAEKEFYATQWAIDHCDKYGIVISQYEKEDWQEYINSFVKDEDKSKFILKW